MTKLPDRLGSNTAIKPDVWSMADLMRYHGENAARGLAEGFIAGKIVAPDVIDVEYRDATDALARRNLTRGTAESDAPVILSIQDVTVEYKTPFGWMQAVCGASMDIRRGEAVAESVPDGEGADSKSSVRMI